jgi:predicted HTH transcriptional regulator
MPFVTDENCTKSSRGLVWETKRGFTAEAQFIDDLVTEWETTSVEFKSDISTDTAGQIAEFIKDVLSLATTKTSGRRWMIIGFDDDTHEYCGSPNPKLTQNHLEQLLQVYTKPMVEVRYQVVDYRKEPVGKLEVFRKAKHLPYKVAKSLGSQNDKRRISEGAIYVRHGSQVQHPTPEELEALEEEGVLARRNH